MSVHTLGKNNALLSNFFKFLIFAKTARGLYCLSDGFNLCFKISKIDSFMISYCYFDEFKYLFRLEGSWETSFCYVVRAIFNRCAMLEYVETSILSICHSDLLSLHIKNEQVDIKS